MRQTIIVFGTLLALAGPALGKELGVGDKAPPLKVDKWVKGGPVDVHADKDTLYVVEFWATWCPPCRMSIPHLTKVQKHFKDKKVVVIGVSDEKEEVVRKFLTTWDKKMEYAVALDAGQTTSAYMEAAGITGIPHAFLVRGGKIEWIGHPLEMDGEIARITKDESWGKMVEADKVVAGKRQKAFEAFSAAMQKEDWTDALKHLEAIEALDPENPRVYMQKFVIQQVHIGDTAAATKSGMKLVEMVDNWEELNGMGRDLIDGEAFDGKGNLAVANAMLEKAHKLTEGKEAAVFDSLARAKFRGGDAAAAIKLTEEGLKLTDDAELKEQMNKSLEEYRTAGKGK